MYIFESVGKGRMFIPFGKDLACVACRFDCPLLPGFSSFPAAGLVSFPHDSGWLK